MPQTDRIRATGVRVHNLKGVDVDLPIGAVIAVTGVSGSGKSSLAIDTLHVEGQRRYLEAFPLHVRQRLPRFDKPDADRIENVPPSIAVGQRIAVEARTTVAAMAGLLDPLQPIFASACDIVCPACKLAVVRFGAATLARKLVAESPGQLATLAFRLPDDVANDVESWSERLDELREAGLIRIAIDGANHRLDGSTKPALPTAGAVVRVLLDRVRLDDGNLGRVTEACESGLARGQGVIDIALDSTAGAWTKYSNRLRCLQCGFDVAEPRPRFFRPDQLERPDLRGYQLVELDFAGWMKLSIAEAETLLPSNADEPKWTGLRTALRQLRERLAYLREVGLGYVSLGRLATTLSTGELRRVALAAAFGAGLSRTMFVLDEPTAGLHPADTDRLIAAIAKLRDRCNTILVVEHDLAVIAAADFVVELGPGAGSKGGEIVHCGPPSSMRPTPPIHRSVRKPRGVLQLIGAEANNLKRIDVSFPLGCLCAVSGPSGAGKSSLVLDCLAPAIESAKRRAGDQVARTWGRIDNVGAVDSVIVVDADSVGRSARANAATFIKIFDDIRALFAETLDGKVGGFAPAAFSFNLPGGRCEYCSGAGVVAIDMDFLDNATMTCPACQGKRYSRSVLDIKFRGLDIAQVLNLTVREAFGFFRNQHRIQDRLNWLIQVGLEYLRIGQPLSTLSGGEAQRLKIAATLGAKGGKRSLFVFDEPTIGLHAQDIGRLLESFDALLAIGHSIIAIEHDPAFLAAVDYVIELGPGAGPNGGQLVASGPRSP